MLPTTGFFKDIDCPYYETTCGRPYCHFNHRKRSQEPPEEHLQTSECDAEIPTYKPTPKSELAGSRSHIPISYVPDLVVRSDRSLRPIPAFNLADRPTYKPTPISILSSTNVSKQCEYTPTNVSHSDDNDLDISALSHEFDMIDEILEDPEVCEKEKTRKEDGKSSFYEFDEILEDAEVSEKEKTRKADGKSSSSKKSSGKDKKKDKERSKRDSDKKDSDKKKEDSDKKKEDSGKKKEESNKKKENSDKKKEKPSSKEKKGEKEDRHRKDKYSRSSKSKHRDKEKERSDHKSKSTHKDKDKIKSDKKKDKKDRSKEKQKSSKSEEKKEKEKPPTSEDYEVPFDSDDDDFEESIEEECYKIFNEYKPPELAPPKPVIEEVPEEDSPPEAYVPTSKKRVAYEKAEQSGSKITYNKPKPIQNAALTLANRMKIAREAHSANEHRNLMSEMQNRQKRPSIDSEAPPAKIVKLDVRNGKTKVAPAKPVSLVDEILGGRSKPIRIAPVRNVNSIQMAKARLDERLKAATNATKTPIQTMNKGSKRVAHVPDMSLTDIPDVLQADKSKLPVNVRTRYLTMLADECVKLYVSKEEAYQRAQQEELKCYERCKVLVTYRNSAMLAVNRLRKELQEREASGLGPVLVGESTGKAQDSSLQGKRFYDSISGYIMTEDELVLHGYPREGAVPGRAIVNTEQRPVTSEHLEANQRLCCRCRKVYLVDDDGFALVEEECMYHPLKKRTLRGERTYLCCKSLDDTGCAISNTHVSEESADRELEGYQSTMDPSGPNDPRSHAVYALDCEMCYTTKGLELTRVTIVDTNLKTVYESLVKPLNPIIDYNTRFSGITKEQMDRTSTSILQVQANILHLCNNKTILIGHSLESDMKALKIVHDTVIDTSILFPHKFGLPHKRALRVLASEYLKKIIQNDIAGHDSAEDALACMELVIWKAKEDMKVKR